MATWTFPVSGLSCHRCMETVDEQISSLSGVRSVEVGELDHGTSQVTVTADREIPDSEIQTALAEGGDFVLER